MRTQEEPENSGPNRKNARMPDIEDIEKRLKVVESIVIKGDATIDDALGGMGLVSQTQVQLLGDFLDSLCSISESLMDSLGSIYQAFGGEIEPEEPPADTGPDLKLVPGELGDLSGATP